jgi:hypothetical protein
MYVSKGGMRPNQDIGILLSTHNRNKNLSNQQIRDNFFVALRQ